MRKLLSGIIDFRKNVRPQRLETFARLANGQTPDVLFVACSDSRVAPNWFASTDPGDLFVIRNVGNMVPPCGDHNHSVAAGIEFSISNLKISDIVICGHSGCGAIHAMATGIDNVKSDHLKVWLETGRPALKFPESKIKFDEGLSAEDRLSQCNVLQQIEHLKTYPIIKEKLRKKEVKIHGWWFEIPLGNVYAFDSKSKKFLIIDEEVAAAELSRESSD